MRAIPTLPKVVGCPLLALAASLYFPLTFQTAPSRPWCARLGHVFRGLLHLSMLGRKILVGHLVDWPATHVSLSTKAWILSFGVPVLFW